MLCCFLAVPAHAAFEKTKMSLQKRQTDNFVLFADEVAYNDQTHTQTASGNVQIVGEPYVLLADQVSYNQDQDVMTARGHVRLMQRQGNARPTEVMFSDYMEMTSDIVNGSVINVRMLFSDNSRLVARDAKRSMGEIAPKTELHDVVYSPCELCKSNPTRAPVWQIRADRVVDDEETHRMRYKNATMEFYGIPFLYTPYLSHPDPSVKQEAGLMPSSYSTSPYLGSFIRNYYYYPISPTQDITAELSYSTLQGPLLGMEWRKAMPHSQYTFQGAVANSELETLTGIHKRFRGFIRGEALWDINRLWRAGAKINYSSDPTFLRQYKYSSEDILTNRFYAERFKGRSYGAINFYKFQDLRPTRPGDQPNLLPYITYTNYGKPGATWGGRWGMDISFLGISRPVGGESVQRLSTNLNWERNWFMKSGLKHTLNLQAQGDLYQVQSADAALAGASNAGKSYMTYRAFPTVKWQSSLPLVKNGSYLQYQLEPLVAINATPPQKNTDIPNEDSFDVELDPTNLLAISRFPGIDRVEDGERITYGVRGGFTNLKGGHVYAFAGQSIRLNGNHDFPNGSGLNERSSDWVGQITAAPSRFLDLDYRLRADHHDMAAKRHEATFNIGPEWLRYSGTYAFLKQVDNTGINTNRHQLSSALTLLLNKNWLIGVSDYKTLLNKPKSLTTSLTLKYTDECFSITGYALRDYTKRVGLDSGDSFYILFSFKNLGDYQTPTFNSLSQPLSSNTQTQ